MEHSNITYKKIADALHVSKSTVSKALTGSREVSRETAEKIHLAAKEMGYFSQKRERNREYAKEFCPEIAILVPEIISISYSDIATRFTNEIERLGGHASIYITGFDKSRINLILEKIYDEVKYDGIILLSSPSYNGKVKLPTMALDSTQESRFDSLSGNLEAGMQEAIRHLIELGHTDIGFVGEMLTLTKEELFKKSLSEAGLPIKEEYIFRINDRFEQIGVQAGKQISELVDPPTAVITAYDEIAIGLMSTLTEKGFNVPKDISVIGINDIPVSRYMYPPLTTITSNTGDKCTDAVEILINKIKKQEMRQFKRHTNTITTLTVRGSTGKAKKHIEKKD